MALAKKKCLSQGIQSLRVVLRVLLFLSSVSNMELDLWGLLSRNPLCLLLRFYLFCIRTLCPLRHSLTFRWNLGSKWISSYFAGIIPLFSHMNDILIPVQKLCFFVKLLVNFSPSPVFLHFVISCPSLCLYTLSWAHIPDKGIFAFFSSLRF